MLNKMLKRNLIVLLCGVVCISLFIPWWLNGQVYGNFEVLAKDALKNGLTPGEVYVNWSCVLVRNGTGAWQLKTWGYG